MFPENEWDMPEQPEESRKYGFKVALAVLIVTIAGVAFYVPSAVLASEIRRFAQRTEQAIVYTAEQTLAMYPQAVSYAYSVLGLGPWARVVDRSVTVTESREKILDLSSDPPRMKSVRELVELEKLQVFEWGTDTTERFCQDPRRSLYRVERSGRWICRQDRR
ncbi:MAG: hypothetical protein Q8P83_03615 [bacterium]|nr:hypothetical protein [bacterium]